MKCKVIGIYLQMIDMELIFIIIAIIVFTGVVFPIIKLNKKIASKYEVKVFELRNNWELNEKIIDLQNKGWQFAGQITVYPDPNSKSSREWVFIPMKRKIN